MRAYSTDLRERIVEAYRNDEGSVTDLAARFKVAPRTVVNYLALERTTGAVSPRPHGGGTSPKLNEAAVQLVRTLVEERNDRTLREIARELEGRLGVHVCQTTVWTALDRLNLPQKKRSVRASRTGSRCGTSARASAREPRGLTRSGSTSSTSSAST